MSAVLCIVLTLGAVKLLEKLIELPIVWGLTKIKTEIEKEILGSISNQFDKKVKSILKQEFKNLVNIICVNKKEAKRATELFNEEFIKRKIDDPEKQMEKIADLLAKDNLEEQLKYAVKTICGFLKKGKIELQEKYKKKPSLVRNNIYILFGLYFSRRIQEEILTSEKFFRLFVVENLNESRKNIDRVLTSNKKILDSLLKFIDQTKLDDFVAVVQDIKEIPKKYKEISITTQKVIDKVPQEIKSLKNKMDRNHKKIINEIKNLLKEQTAEIKEYVKETVVEAKTEIIKEYAKTHQKQTLHTPIEIQEEKNALVNAILETSRNAMKQDSFFGRDLKELNFFVERTQIETGLSDTQIVRQRKTYSQQIREFLGQDAKNILLIIGEGDIGKSWLMAKEIAKMLPEENGNILERLTSSYIPLTYLCEDLIYPCRLNDAICNNLLISMDFPNDINYLNKFNQIKFWRLVNTLNNESNGIVFFLDDLSNITPKCTEFYDRELKIFVKQVVECGSKIVLNARTSTYKQHIKKTEVEADKISLFGFPAEVLNLPRFSPEEAFQVWKFRDGPNKEQMKDYIKQNSFLCHPLILKFAVEEAKRVGEWHPKSKIDVLEKFLAQRFYELPKIVRDKYLEITVFYKYLANLALAVIDGTENEFEYNNDFDQKMFEYKLYDRKENKTIFYHDTILSFLLIRGMMPEIEEFKQMSKRSFKKLLTLIWNRYEKRKHLNEIIEFTILHFLELKSIDIGLRQKVGEGIRRLIEYSKDQWLEDKKEEWSSFWFNTSQVLKNSGFSDEAEICMQIVRKIYPKATGRTLGDKLILLFSQYEFNEVLTESLLYLERFPQDNNAWRQLGEAYALKGHYQEAIRCYNKAIDLKDDYIEAIEELGNVYYKIDDYEKAIELYMKILKLLPNRTDTLDKIAKINIRLGKFAEALDYYNLSLSLARKENNASNISRILTEISSILILQENYARAQFILDEALQLDNSNIDALLFRGKLFLITGDNYETKNYMLDVLKLNKESWEACVILGDIFSNEENLTAASKYYKKAIKYQPDLLEVIFKLGIIQYKLRMYEHALELFYEVINKDKDFIEAWYEVAKCYAKLKMLDKAMVWIEKLIKRSPHYLNEISSDDAFRELTYKKEFTSLTFDKKEKISILFLAADPATTRIHEISDEIYSIEKELNRNNIMNNFEFIIKIASRITDLSFILRKTKPDIIHLTSIGSSIGEIVLLDEARSSRIVTTETLSNIFSVFGEGIRCVVLNGCFSEKQAQAIAKHVDCVVGIPSSIKEENAIEFVGKMYNTLGLGNDLATAFYEAIRQQGMSITHHSTPKLIAGRRDPGNIQFIR